MNIPDIEKTNRLREKIKGMQDQSKNADPREEEKAKEVVKALSYFIKTVLTVLYFWGAQVYVLEKCKIEPFTFWQSTVILLGTIYVVKIIKAN